MREEKFERWLADEKLAHKCCRGSLLDGPTSDASTTASGLASVVGSVAEGSVI